MPRTVKRKRSLFGLTVLFLAALFIIMFSVSLLSFSFSERVAVIPFKGSIEDSSYAGAVSSREMISFLRQAEKDGRVKAVLLEINSPGGTPVETKQIAYYIRSEMDKPVVAWIGDVGASGAYYVAASCDKIVADPDSLTGSIGVIATLFSVSRLLEGYGVDVNLLREGRHKGMGSVFEELNEEDKALFEEVLSQAYHNFRKDVLEFRSGKISEQELDGVADGRILTGKQAHEIGLIDVLGTREDALTLAGELGGIKGKPKTIVLQRKGFSLASMFFEAGAAFGSGFRQSLYSSQGVRLG